MKIITRCGMETKSDIHLSNLVDEGTRRGVIPDLYKEEVIFDVRYNDKSGLYTIVYLYSSISSIALMTTKMNWKVSWSVPVAIEEVIISHRS